MKFKLKPTPNHGETRIITRFLWTPVGDGTCIRWLEFAKIKQKYYYGSNPRWYNLEFVD
jgi:hypothetical protein